MGEFRIITDRKSIEQLSEELRRYICGMRFPYVFMENDTVLIKGEIQFYKDNSVYVRMVDSIYPRKGNGRVFINYLKSLPDINEIFGESVPDAVPFWDKMGAIFEKSAYKIFLAGGEFEEDFLIPFTISC